MSEDSISYQCWICPYCYDDHWSDGPCKEKDLKERIESLKKREAKLVKALEDQWEGEHYEYCSSENCPGLSAHVALRRKELDES